MATNQEMHSATYVTVATNLDGKVSEVPNKVWNTKVNRDGKQISVIQELADTKSLALENKAAIAALTELVSQLAAGQSVDYAKIKDAVKAGLSEGLVTVDVNVKGHDPA